MKYTKGGFPFKGSPLHKEIEGKEFSTIEDDPSQRINVSDDYKEGEFISDKEFEAQFSQTGDDPKDYPQYSVQDYSKVRKDEKGNYVVRLQD